ncbi:hypothetical protein U0O11_10745 [Cobetia sp. D5]|uniref:hypothetical protein n=1 Tax=Cobetia sp. D5 TaxID=3105867 RepID=UPI002D77B368|nr:hypothetical protein [Cobetia sp. D5]
MINIILHIGRHKTGTSTLQKYLYSFPNELRKHGYEYFEVIKKGYGHHHIAEPLAKGVLKNTVDSNLLVERIAGELESYLEWSCDKTYIISSEAFQNTDPKVIRQLFPQNKYNVKVVVYFREQADYLASSYAQKVHASLYTGTIYDYYKRGFDVDYLKFINAWDHCFGKISVRFFDKKLLIQSDIVDDFTNSVLGFSSEIDKANLNDNNPSLGQKYVALKLKINKLINDNKVDKKLITGKQYKELGQRSQRENDNSYALPKSLLDKVRSDSEAINKKLFELYCPGYEFSLKEHVFREVVASEEEALYTLEEISKVDNIV